MWKRTSGNALDTADGDPASWILQVPDTWGWAGLLPRGADKPGIKNLVQRMRSVISRAERCVDITGFGVEVTGIGAFESTFTPVRPFPDGEFAKAIGTGLKEAANKAAEQGRRRQPRLRHQEQRRHIDVPAAVRGAAGSGRLHLPDADQRELDGTEVEQRDQYRP